MPCYQLARPLGGDMLRDFRSRLFAAHLLVGTFVVAAAAMPGLAQDRATGGVQPSAQALQSIARDPSFLREKHLSDQRAYPFNQIPAGAYDRARRQYEAAF